MNTYMKMTLLVSWGGLLFTGIICGSRLFVGEWLLQEPTPFFLWFPSWWFCFVLFTALFLSTALLYGKGPRAEAITLTANTIIAFLGSLLTGRFVVEVILAQLGSDLPPKDYVIMFPWSLYVFTLFLAVFMFSICTLIFGTEEARIRPSGRK